MPLLRFANGFATTLTAGVDAVATTLAVTTTVGLPAVGPLTGGNDIVTAVLVDGELMYVTAIPTGTSLTVQRGREGTTATTHAGGATLSQVVTRDGLYRSSAPGGIATTIATGTQTYTPNATAKYHFLTVGGTTNLTINAPTAGPMPLEIGDEIRLHFTITATALSAQPTWNAVFDGTGAPTPTITLTAGARSSISWAYRGGATNPLWRRIQ